MDIFRSLIEVYGVAGNIQGNLANLKMVIGWHVPFTRDFDKKSSLLE